MIEHNIHNTTGQIIQTMDLITWAARICLLFSIKLDL